MRSEESDHHHAVCILHQANQTKIVCLDIEYYPAALKDARLGMCFLHILRRLPCGRFYQTNAWRLSLARAMYPVDRQLPVAFGVGTLADSTTKSFSKRIPTSFAFMRKVLIHRIEAREPSFGDFHGE